MATGIASHVWLDADGVAWIDDTNIKVIEVALEKIAHGSSPEEIYDQHRGHLSLAQIHAALTFYFDHQAEMDAEIDRQLREFFQRDFDHLDVGVINPRDSSGIQPDVTGYCSCHECSPWFRVCVWTLYLTS